MRIDPRCLIYPGIRASYDEARLEAELTPLKNLHFRVLPILSSSMLEAMGFQAHDPTLEALGDRHLALADLPPPGAKRMDSLAVVIALLYTDLLETSPLPVNRTAEIPAPKIPHSPSPHAPSSHAPQPARPEPARRTSTGTFPVVNLGKAPTPSSTPRATGAHAIPAAVMNAAEWNKTPSNNAAHATLGGRITELYDKLGTISHFQLLGVPENAPLADLGGAYLKAVRLYHPDRLPSLGLGHLTEKAARIVAQLNEAQSVLADPKRRSEYQAQRARPANTPIVDSGQSIMAAERSYQMGEVLLRKGDFVKAAEAFAEAMRANPIEPFYKAYWAWARWDNPGPHKDRLVRETLKILEDMMKERPKFPQGHYWIGMLHKHLGDLQNAAAAFRAAIGQDPNLLDAERELRVIELRRSKATAAHAVPEKPSAASAARQKSGVINKILKR
jgi:tetratricopeptide (TPR) repeat protein